MSLNNFIGEQFDKIHQIISNNFFPIISSNNSDKLNEKFKQKQLIEYNQILKNCPIKDLKEINRYIGKIELLIDLITSELSNKRFN